MELGGTGRRRPRKSGAQFLEKSRNPCYIIEQAPSHLGRQPLAAREGDEIRSGHPAQGLRRGKDFFIWIRRNPLKSPDSAKGIQGNPSFFPWFYLDFLAFICICLATAAEPGRARVLCLRFGARWARPSAPAPPASATSACCCSSSIPRSARARAEPIGGFGRCARTARRSRRRGRDTGARP
jgi:hypothetical protein